MKIDRLKIVERLTGAGIEHENAVIAATKIGVAYDEAEQDMASKQDLDLIAERFETKINAAICQTRCSEGSFRLRVTADKIASCLFSMV